MELSREDNLIIQSYSIVAFLEELVQKDFVNDTFYKEKISSRVKDSFKQTGGIDNQGCLLIFLYAMLVIPRELYEDKLSSSFDALNSVISKEAVVIQNDYDKEDYIRHMRNSVSHATVEFDPRNTVTFTDKNNKNGKLFVFSLPLKKVGFILANLQKILSDYYTK